MKFNFFSKPKVGISEAGIGMVRRSSPVGKTDEAPQDISLQQRYDNAYNNYPMVSAAIDKTAEQAVQKFWFEGPNSDKLKKWSEKVNLPNKLPVIAKHMVKNGNMWVEFPSDSEMKFIDPKTMTTHRKLDGDVIGHTQDIDHKKVAIWGTIGDKDKDKLYAKDAPLKDIVHFKFNLLAGDKYGTSIIHSSLSLLEVKGDIENNLKIIVRRYAAPLIHVQAGNEMWLPSDTDVDNLKKDFEDIYADTEYVTNHLINMDVKGFEGKAMKLDYILKHIDMNIITGLQIMPEVLGYGDSDKSVAEVRLRDEGRHIKAVQRAIATEFDDNVIIGRGLGSFEDHIVFGDAEEREHEIEVDIIRGLVTDGIITPQKANSLLPEEFREDLPPELANPAKQAFASQQQDQRPFQKGADKIHDKPTDPTKKQIEPGKRRVKTDRAKTS
jgi:hypothetical protein